MINTDQISRQKLQFCAYKADQALSWEQFKSYLLSEYVSFSSKELQAHYCVQAKEDAAFHFEVQGHEIALCINNESIEIDLNKTLSQKAQIIRKEGAKNQLIYKALGSSKFGQELKVLDTTAGFADDACWFLALGADVVMSERNPLLFCLLANSLTRFRLPSDRLIKLLYGSSANLDGFEQYSAIYYDPFFQKKKSAKTKKNMEILGSQFHDDDLDAVEVAKSLLEKCHSRLIIKRSDKAPQLIEKPTYEIKGKTVRFDIYYRGQKQ